MTRVVMLLLVLLTSTAHADVPPPPPPLELTFTVVRAKHSKDSHTTTETWKLSGQALVYRRVTTHRHGEKDADPETFLVLSDVELREALQAPEVRRRASESYAGTPGPGVDTTLRLVGVDGRTRFDVKVSGATTRYGSDVQLPFEAAPTVVALRRIEALLRAIAH